MRKTPEEQNRINMLIAAQTERRMNEFDGEPMVCPGMGDKPCGSNLFEQKPLVVLQYVPEIVSGNPGGIIKFNPVTFLRCVKCGHFMPPEEWEKAAKEAYEKKDVIITPNSIKPRDNGDGDS